MRPALPTILAALMSASAALALLPHPASADPYADLARYTFGQSREPLAAIDAEIRKTPASGYKDIENRILAALRSPEATKDARRFICRWLGVVGSAECVPAVADLLTDQDLSHPARMALEPMKNAAAGAALRAALPKAKGKLLAGIVSSIGVRRDAEAVDALARLASDADPVVAGAAMLALGEIGTEKAADTLLHLRSPEKVSRTLARAKLVAAAHLAAAGNSEKAAQVYVTLAYGQKVPAVRMAAVKGMIGTFKRPDAVRVLRELLESDDTATRAAAIAAYLGANDKAMKDAVAEQLPAMKPAGQLVLLRALADQPDVAARSAVLKVLEAASDVDIRVAALECLAIHGDAGDVGMVVRLARAKPQAVAEAAHISLQRMGKAGVDEALAGLIESPDAADRAVVLAALSDRRVESALPILSRLVGSPDAAVAAEAAKGLGVLGKSEQLTALAGVLANPQTSGPFRRAADDAVKAICARADKQAAAKALLTAMDKAATPAARSAILPLLIHTRGEEALSAVHKAIDDQDALVREAAIRTLVAWPEAAAAPHLIAIARRTDKPAHAVLALRDGCLRLANLKEVPLAERLGIYRGVLEAAKRPEEKKQAVAGLAQLPSPGALELLDKCRKDASLEADATSAVIRLARQIGPIYPKQAKAALVAIQSQAAREEVKKEVAEALASLKNVGQSPDGFILAWQLSGPYEQEGKDCSALFRVPFPPEKPGAKAAWRPLAATPGAQAGLVEIDKALGGHNRAAYLKTSITSTKEQDALLTIGSDDGVKVWLNGKVVHANNAVRPCAPDQDKARVKLKQGTNTLLVKVTQGGGQWTVCCRLRTPDGKALSGVSVAPSGP